MSEKSILLDRTGETVITKQGQISTIIRYKDNKEVDIKFEDGTIVTNKSYNDFKRGSVKNPNHLKSIREKEVVETKSGKLKLIKYTNAKNITVQFEDGTTLENKNYGNFKKGNIKNPNEKTFKNVGYIGIGEYNSNDESFTAWCHMINRCYDKTGNDRYENYVDCVVCEEWHNFQNFAKWYYANKWGGDLKLEVDKDIISSRENNIYCEEKCLLVDQRINKLFINREEGLGRGVAKTKDERYISQCHVGKTSRYLGTFDTVEEAKQEYYRAKKEYIKQVADEYKNKYKDFPNKVYRAMLNYRVH